MQVQSINNNAPSFGVLNLTSEVKVLIERERGGKAAIKRATKDLENSRWDLNIKRSSKKNGIYPYFGSMREACVIPCHVQDEFVMVCSPNSHNPTDAEANIIDCLKFSSAQRAQEVYDTLKDHFTGGTKNPLKHFNWSVYAMKAFTEAELVPQKESPWADFLDRYTYIPLIA